MSSPRSGRPGAKPNRRRSPTRRSVRTARFAQALARLGPELEGIGALIDLTIADLPRPDPRAVARLAESPAGRSAAEAYQAFHRELFDWLAAYASRTASSTAAPKNSALSGTGSAAGARDGCAQPRSEAAYSGDLRRDRFDRAAARIAPFDRRFHHWECSEDGGHEPFLQITTAIPYANGAPHIGHAYERIATDAIQRFMWSTAWNRRFVTGMDEHGLKVQQAAAREGVTPRLSSTGSPANLRRWANC